MFSQYLANVVGCQVSIELLFSVFDVTMTCTVITDGTGTVMEQRWQEMVPEIVVLGRQHLRPDRNTSIIHFDCPLWSRGLKACTKINLSNTIIITTNIINQYEINSQFSR